MYNCLTQFLSHLISTGLSQGCLLRVPEALVNEFKLNPHVQLDEQLIRCWGVLSPQSSNMYLVIPPLSGLVQGICTKFWQIFNGNPVFSNPLKWVSPGGLTPSLPRWRNLNYIEGPHYRICNLVKRCIKI